MLDTVVDRIWLLPACAGVLLLAGFWYCHRTTPMYEATATVQVEQEEQRVVKIEQVLKEDLRTQETMNTIVQKLRSQPLLERVLASNGVNTASALLGSSETPGATSQRLAPRLAGMAKATLRRNTRLIDVTVANPDPRLAARLANSIVEQYMIQDSEVRSSSTRGAYSFLKEESERLRKKLEASEQALQAYRESAGSGSMLQAEDIILPQLRELSLRVTQARSDTIRLKAAVEQLQAAGTNVWAIVTNPQIAADPAVIESRSNLAKLENDFALLKQRYKPKHPKYIQAVSQLEDSRRSLSNCVFKAAESVRIAYDNALATEKGMEKSFAEAEASALKHSQQAIRYNLLTREAEADRALFANVLNRLKETSLSTDMQPEKIRVVAPAMVPDLPARPNTRLVLAGALLAGLLLGCALALCLGFWDTSFQTVEDAEDFLHLPVLSTILKLRDLRKAASPILPTQGTRAPGAEAFRTLRTSLAMLGREAERRTFLFTSALPQEGKTFSSLNYAASLAAQGFRTLLIDADLRRPSVAKLLADGEELPGVTDYLLGRKALAEIIRPEVSQENLFWVSAGHMAPNPAELLSQGGFRELVRQALEEFDRVVIDSAPVHAVSDTLLIADCAQTTVLVIRGGSTPRKAAARCAQLLIQAGAVLGGIFLNRLPRGHRRSYGYYGYTYDYGSEDKPRKRRRSTSLPQPAEVAAKS